MVSSRYQPPVLHRHSALFKADAAERVVVAALPRSRAAMHLDTVFTFCDRDVVTAFTPVVDRIRTLTLLRDDADYWLALALGVGVIGGTGGAWMRSREPFRSIAWGLAGAAACAEGAALLVLVISRDRALGDGARLLVAEVSLGVGVLVWAAREFRPVTVAVSALGWCALGFLGGLVVLDHLV